MTTQNYYETLGLAPFAEGAMVDQAYWHLAKTYQGLAEADPRARQALDDLNEAYAVLGTPRLREEYDSTLPDPGKPKASAAAIGHNRASQKMRFSLPKWPFGRSDGEPEVFEARVRELGPVAAKPDVQAQAQAQEGLREPPRRPRKAEVADLHASTARMLERWRVSASNAAQAAQPSPEASPDMTLVDIFKTEKDLVDHGDPLAAVMDILKAPKDRVPASPDR